MFCDDTRRQLVPSMGVSATRTVAYLLEIDLGIKTSIPDQVNNPALALLARHAQSIRKLAKLPNG